jgi:L-amino acid N-acyltransferase YncA
MDTTIREVRPDDAEDQVRVLNPIIQAGTHTAMDRTYTVEEQRRFIEEFPARGVFMVAEREGRVVGLQSVEPFASYTGAFDHVGVIGTYVDLAIPRQGIGRRMSDVTFEVARGKGYEKIFTYVRADNGPALAFYGALGFRTVGTAERQAKFGEKYVDEVIIEKFLV